MTDQRPGADARATIELSSPTGLVELSIVDDEFRVVAAGVGSLQAEVEPGIYEAVARAGPESDRRLVKVAAGETRRIPDLAVPFPAAAPVEGTSTARRSHMVGAREATELAAPPAAGEGALVVVLRDVRGSDGPPLTADDVAGLELLDSRLRRVPTPAADWSIDEREAIGRWRASVPAGGYVLRRAVDDGPGGRTVVDQSLWVGAGYQTVVFLLRPGTAGGPAWPSVHVIPAARAWRSFHPLIGTAFELALWQLRLPGSARGLAGLAGVEDEVADDPMLGIVVAHAILQRDPPDLERVAAIVSALDRVVPGHPDVAGLRLLAAGGSALASAVPAVTWPPMLLAGYLALIRRDAAVPGTIARGSVAETAAARLAVRDIWTTWDPLPADRVAPADERASPYPVLARLAAEPDLLDGLRPTDPAEQRVASWLAGVGDIARLSPVARTLADLELRDVALATHLPTVEARRAVIGLGHGLPPPGDAGREGDGGDRNGGPGPRPRPPEPRPLDPVRRLTLPLSTLAAIGLVGLVVGTAASYAVTGGFQRLPWTDDPTPTQAAVTQGPEPSDDDASAATTRRSPTPAASAEPSVPPSLPPPPPDLAIDWAFDALEVDAFGTWRGAFSVSASGGTPPYEVEVLQERRESDGTVVFELAGETCLELPVTGSVRDSDGQARPIETVVRPEECLGYEQPPPPVLGDPSDGTIVTANCVTTPVGFGWSPPDVGPGATYRFELERLDGNDWTPLVSEAGLVEPVLPRDVPCDSRFRWSAATVSPDGWASELSDYFELIIRPTAVPVPAGDAPVLNTCVFDVPLSWAVTDPEGITGYRIDLTDLATGETTSETTDATTHEMPVPTCDTEYQWTVSSIDSAGVPGTASEPAFFSMPSAPR